MDKIHTIPEISTRLKKTDNLLMDLLKIRMDLALEVERRKDLEGEEDPKKKIIFNPKRETERLAGVDTWARKHGINRHFARTILYAVIGESCKQQMIQMQKRKQKKTRKGHALTSEEKEKQWQSILRRNLLTLTRKWSETYDTEYETAFFATRAYREFEDGVITEEIDGLSGDTKVLLDLGCATGKVAFKFANRFERTVGYDISPHMVNKANSKIATSGTKNISFKVTDLENGIPEPDHSVSMVVMNLGTASDIRGISKIVKEISRVLRPHGRFVLSFYNREALLYNWDFIPWQVGLAAVVNTYKDCLDVPFGTKLLSVYARPYSSEEVTEIVKGGVTLSQILTYPTISALLPTDLFENQPKIQKSVKDMDRQLAGELAGAYIIVTGQKTR